MTYRNIFNKILIISLNQTNFLEIEYVTKLTFNRCDTKVRQNIPFNTPLKMVIIFSNHINLFLVILVKIVIA